MTISSNKKLFTEPFHLLKKNIFYFLLLDASLIVSLYSINYLISSYIFDFRNMLAVIQQNNLLIFVLLPLIIIYLLILLLVYSIFKYFTLEIIAEKESEAKFKNILKLYRLNTKIFSIFFVLFAIINIVFFSIPNEYMVAYAFATMLPFIFLLTLFIDVLHADFALNINKKGNNKLRFKRIFENKRLIVTKILFYIGIIILYLLYNHLGTNRSILLMPYTVLSLIIVYAIMKIEMVLALEVLHK